VSGIRTLNPVGSCTATQKDTAAACLTTMPLCPDSNWIARIPRTVLGLVLAERPAKFPFGVQASPSGICWTTRSLWTVHRLDPSGVLPPCQLVQLGLFVTLI
jgi:hypothetical protein